MPKEVHAPYYTGQIKSLIGRRDDPQSIITPTRHRIFLEIRHPITLEVPLIKRVRQGEYVVNLIPWTARPGQVLMPCYDIVSRETAAVIGPIIGFRGTRLKRVELIEDIEAAARQQVHILEGYIGKHVSVHGQTIAIPGEIDQLQTMIENLSQAKPIADEFDDLLAQAEHALSRARSRWRVAMRAALKRGDVASADRHALQRIGEIYDIIEGILRREREVRRIIDKIHRGFDAAYTRMYAAIQEARAAETTSQRAALGQRIQKKILDYLTRYVGAFEPFYSGARTDEVLALANTPGYLLEGKDSTVINLLEAAMNSIEKFVLGRTPSAARIRNLRARAERRRPQ